MTYILDYVNKIGFEMILVKKKLKVQLRIRIRNYLQSVLVWVLDLTSAIQYLENLNVKDFLLLLAVQPRSTLKILKY